LTRLSTRGELWQPRGVLLAFWVCVAQLLSMPPGAGAESPDGAYIINSIAAGAQHVSCADGGPSVLVAVPPAVSGSGPCAGRLATPLARATMITGSPGRTPRCVLWLTRAYRHSRGQLAQRFTSAEKAVVPAALWQEAC